MHWIARVTEENEARGERIVALMERRGWTDISLAKEIGCNRSTVWHWRTGAPISGRYVGPLVEALGSTRDWIVSGIGPTEGLNGRALEEAAEGELPQAHDEGKPRSVEGKARGS